jgi:iron-sulfur cluster assembly protein
MSGLGIEKLLPVTLTSRAIEEVKNIIATKNIPQDYSLRIGIKGGGCSGLSYMLGFDKTKATDDTFLVDGVSVLIEKKHTMYLLGLQVDYEDGVNASGFVFVNPDAPTGAEQ